MGHAGMGWVIQGYGGVGHVVKQPKNDSPQNQDLTPPKSFLEGVQNLNFEYKIIIIILLLQLCYIPNYIKKLLPDAPCIKILMA